MSPLMTIARREFRSYFDSPLAYIIICLSLFVTGLLFFLGFFTLPGFWKMDRASMQLLFDLAPWGLCVLVVPVVTMRLLAEERRSGTLEMLITLPVRDSDVILGKYLGALGLILVLIAGTALFPIAMFFAPWNLGPLDWSAVWSGYAGLVLMSAAAVSVGLLVSALTHSQAVAAIVTFLVLLALYGLMGMAADRLPVTMGTVFRFVSFSDRMEGFTKGLVHLRDIVYFLSITVVCLMVSFRALERRKWA